MNYNVGNALVIVPPEYIHHHVLYTKTIEKMPNFVSLYDELLHTD